MACAWPTCIRHWRWSGRFAMFPARFKEKERMKNEANAYYRDKLIKAGGRQAWQELSTANSELTDELWARLRPKLEGEASAEMLSAEAFAVDQEQVAAGKADGFRLVEAAHAGNRPLTEYRMMMDTLRQTLTGRKKLILDDAGHGRRHLFLGVQPPNLPPIILPAAPPSEE